MNTPAFGFILIGWSFFIRYYLIRRGINFFLAAFFMVLGGLIKTSAIGSIFVLLGAMIIENIGIIKLGKNGNRLFVHVLNKYLFIVLLLALTTLWYMYASAYNQKNGTAGIFLIGILPIWKLAAKQIFDYWEAIKTVRIYDYMSLHLQVITIIFLGFIVSKVKRNINIFSICMFLLLGSFTVFYIFFFKAFKIHDYYLINQLIVFVFIWIVFFHTLSKEYPAVFKSVYVKLLFIILLLHNIELNSNKLRARFKSFPQQELYQTYHEVEPLKEKYGIKKEDKVICMPDQSPNISLYFANQKGWTNYSCNSEASMIDKIERGAKYLFIHNPDLYSKKYIHKFTNDLVFSHKNIQVYKLETVTNNTDSIYTNFKKHPLSAGKLIYSRYLDFNDDTTQIKIDSLEKQITYDFITKERKYTSASLINTEMFRHYQSNSNINIRLSTNVFLLDSGLNNTLHLDCIIKNGAKTVLYKSFPIKGINSQWEKINSIASGIHFKEEYQLTVYFYNPNETEYYIDDLFIEIFQ